MSKDAEREVQQQLEEAFAAFRASLTDALTASAQRSVDETIEQLSVMSGPFNVDSADIEVFVRNINLRANDGERSSAARVARPKRQPARRARQSGSAGRHVGGEPKRGRPDGPVRAGLLAAFRAAPDAEHTPASLTQELKRQGVASSTANLHQQLRRLVTAGVIVRSGRGVYQLADSPALS